VPSSLGGKRDFPRGIPRSLHRSRDRSGSIDGTSGVVTTERSSFFLSRGESSIASVRFFDALQHPVFARTRLYYAGNERVEPPCHCRFRTADNHLLLMIEALCCSMRRESTLFYDCKNLRSHFTKVKRNAVILTPF